MKTKRFKKVVQYDEWSDEAWERFGTIVITWLIASFSTALTLSHWLPRNDESLDVEVLIVLLLVTFLPPLIYLLLILFSHRKVYYEEIK